jgi:hypothetical protein
MSNYTKSTDFASKDSLASGNAAKIVKGTEIDTEFNNIATAIATKADLASPTFTGTPSLPSGTTGVTQSTSDDSTKLATTAFVQDVVDAIKSSLYPVGSIYTNATSSTNPGTLLGFGTWTAFGAGRFMVGLNAGDTSFDTAEETGGSKNAIVVSHTHTATVTDPGHSHTFNAQDRVGGGGGGYSLARTNANEGTNLTGLGSGAINANATGISVGNSTEGSSGTNANLPPYIVVYMWKRTA